MSDSMLPEEIGHLPFSSLTAGMLWQLLGPTAKYLGLKGESYTKKAVENLERIFTDAYNKTAENARASGAIPPRVLHMVVSEGAYVEDAVAAGYYGGVLASSKSDSPRDDRGVVFNALIARLSVFQLRLHFIVYATAHNLLQGTNAHFGSEFELHNEICFGTTGLFLAMSFH